VRQEPHRKGCQKGSTETETPRTQHSSTIHLAERDSEAEKLGMGDREKKTNSGMSPGCTSDESVKDKGVGREWRGFLEFIFNRKNGVLKEKMLEIKP